MVVERDAAFLRIEFSQTYPLSNETLLIQHDMLRIYTSDYKTWYDMIGRHGLTTQRGMTSYDPRFQISARYAGLYFQTGIDTISR